MLNSLTFAIVNPSALLLTWLVWLCTSPIFPLARDNPISYGLLFYPAVVTADATQPCMCTVTSHNHLGRIGGVYLSVTTANSHLSPSVIPPAPWTICHSSETLYHWPHSSSLIHKDAFRGSRTNIHISAAQNIYISHCSHVAVNWLFQLQQLPHNGPFPLISLHCELTYLSHYLQNITPDIQ